MEDGGQDELGPLRNALEDDLNRRDLLRNAATLGAAVLAPLDWLSQPAPKPTGEPAGIAAVRDALMRYDSLESPSHVQGLPASLPVLRRRLDRAWAAFQSSRYSMLGSQLPRLLTATQHAVKELDGDGRLQACGLLAEAYQLAAAMLLKLGDSNSAWVAADRGVLAAEQAEDRSVVASAARILAYAFIDARHFGKAKDLTVAAAGALEADLSSSPAQLSLYGALLQKGAMAAAYQGDRITSRALLGEADTIARRLGGDANHWFTAFGPTNVNVHRVSAAVALGDGESPSSTPGASIPYSSPSWSAAPSFWLT
jgi:hypothetical protein